MAVNRERLESVFDSGDVLEVDIPGLGPVRLKSPVFRDWYAIVQEQRDHEGKMLPDSVIARTVAACLVDDNGQPLLEHPSDALRLPPSVMMAIYNRCVEDVMKLRDNKVEADAKK
jgi:hypothetical protein